MHKQQFDWAGGRAAAGVVWITLAGCLSAAIVWPAAQAQESLAAAETNTAAHPAAAAGPATPASAADSGQLDEIVITAQKRAQKAEEVGIAVTEIGAEGLRALGHQDVTALVQQVPSLQVQTYGPSATVFNIRGVSQNNITDDLQEAPIAFYSDEVYVAAMGAISGQTFDLDRVEVLRGPQGTLFGRNATGGLIQAISAKPTSYFESYASLNGGSFGELGSAAAISGPLSDGLEGRLSWYSNRHDGYVKNLIGPDTGSQNFYAARGQLLAHVGTGGMLLFKLELMRNDHEAPGAFSNTVTYLNSPREGGPGAAGLPYSSTPTLLGVPLPANRNYWGGSALFPFLPSCDGCSAFGYKPPDPNNPFVQEYNQPSNFNRTWWNAMLRYDQELPFGSLTSITDFQKLIKAHLEDSDGTQDDLFNTYLHENLYQTSEELRLAGQTQRLNWLVGVYGLYIHSEHRYSLGGREFGNVANGVMPDSFGPGSPGDIPLYINYGGVQQTKSAAVFSQFEYQLLPQLSIIAGGRFSADWKRLDYNVEEYDTAAFGPPIPAIPAFSFNPTLYPDLAAQFFGSYSSKFELDYKPVPDLLLYASVNRGTKSGGFSFVVLGQYNDPFAPPYFSDANFSPVDPKTIPFKQEVLTSYEGGTKMTVWDNRATINAALFHYDYHNYQAFNYENAIQYIVNRPAVIDGVETEIRVRPLSALTLSVFGTLLYKAVVHDMVLPGSDGANVIAASNRMPNAPRWSVGWSGIYTLATGSRGTLALATDWKYDSAQYLTAFNAAVDLERPRAIGNVRLSYTSPGGRLELGLFANNVTNRYYRLFSFDNTLNFGGLDNNVYAPPRWFGGSFTYHLGAARP